MAIVDSHFISQITAAERLLSGKEQPIKGGPTAMAQKHANQPLTSAVISDITQGEKEITNDPKPKQGGPTSIASSILASESQGNTTTTANTASGNMTGGSGGVINSNVIHEITEREKDLTGESRPVKGGPTAEAQKHAGQTINSDTLHDITEGEKKVTGGDRVKGGPTSAAQSELSKSRQ